MLFADKIKKLRKRLNVSQTTLAKMLNVSQSSVACWETGVNECAPEIRLRLKSLCAQHRVRIGWRK